MTRPIASAAALVSAVLLSFASLAVSAQPAPASGAAAVAELGKPGPDFTLTSPQGRTYTLAQERAGQKATVVMFIATQCPVSNAYNERMAQLARDYTPKKVRFLGVNANKQESIEEVAKHAKDHKLPFPVLIDVGNVVADRYGAAVTPHVFVLDSEGILRYRGRIDDSQDASGVKSQDLRLALDALLEGKPVPRADTKAFGCSIKRMEKE